jgi:hypothetical protein
MSSLQKLRFACVCSWLGFGVLFVLGKARLLTTLQEEILTSINDVAAKAFISLAIYLINFQSQERKAMLEMLTVEKMIGSSATVRIFRSIAKVKIRQRVGITTKLCV